MSNLNEYMNFILQVTEQKYTIFCLGLKDKISSAVDLHLFREEENCSLISQLCAEIYSEEILLIRSLLDKKDVGIAALDVPQSNTFSKKENAVFGAAVVMGIFNNIGSSTIDPVDNTPFTLYSASHSSAEQLESKGLESFPLETKLGFHNDGLLSDEQIEIPAHIMVYNFYISYRRPGDFVWIPTALWEEAEKYEKIAKDKNVTVRIKLTPGYRFNETNDLVNTVFDYVEAPVARINECGQLRFFLNGRVLPEDNLQEHVDFVKNIRSSLEKNSVKISIPQKERRAFYIKNTEGFHARHIFEDPIEGVDLTRVYLRAVDTESEIYSPC